MTIIGIDHLQLAMPAGEEAVAEVFYAGILGIPRVPKPDHLTARGGCWFETDSTRVHLGVEADFRPARKAHPALIVDDLAGLIDLLREHGHEVTVGDSFRGYEQVYVDGPFGNRIELLGAPPSS